MEMNPDLRSDKPAPREEVTGGWTKYIMRGFHDLYSSPDTIRVII
jgi:hypothetical protein